MLLSLFFGAEFSTLRSSCLVLQDFGSSLPQFCTEPPAPPMSQVGSPGMERDGPPAPTKLVTDTRREVSPSQ